jgi:hypothetical protein
MRISKKGVLLVQKLDSDAKHEASRQKRMQDQLQQNSFNTSSHGEVIRMKDISYSHPMSNIEHTIMEIHDILRSYYKVARKRFTDNVFIQAADYYLVTGPNTPLKLFSPSFVSNLTESQLENIAGEDVMMRRKRAALVSDIKRLEAAKRVLA